MPAVFFFYHPVLLTCVKLAPPLLVFEWNPLHLASNLIRTSSDKHIYRNQICILQDVSVGARVCEFRGYEEKARKLNLVLGTDPSKMIDLRPLLFLTITQVVVLHTVQSACNFLNE